MNSPNFDQERQIDTDAQDHGEETRYAVEHGGREKHPTQKEQLERQPSTHRKADPPWQID